MAVINFAHRELTAKVVYFGAAAAGCDTNLTHLHEVIAEDCRSDLFQFGPADASEHSRYFEHRGDHCPEVLAFATRFRVYSLPGALKHPVHRRVVLADADAVIFVADARPDRSTANLDGLLELERILAESGRALASLPTVIQVNHSDAVGARPVERVAFDLNPFGFPVVGASATSGKGIVETWDTAASAVRDQLQLALRGSETGLTLHACHRKARMTPHEVVAGHLAQLEEAEAPRRPAAHGAEYRSLPPGPEVIIPFLPPELLGTRPAQILGGAVEDDDVVLDVVMTRLSGLEPRRLTLRLVARPVEVGHMPLPIQAARLDPDDRELRVTASLPDAVPLPGPTRDLAPLTYGVVGLVGGLVSGVLLGFLLLV